jgi:hypothetical protein
VTARRRRRRRPGDLSSELQYELRSVAPPNAFVVLWRWRWEVGILLGLVLTVTINRLGWIWTLTLPGVAGVIYAWPEARYWVAARMSCIVTAHRMRTGCAQAWIQTRSGKLPIILLTSARPDGERVFICCRAGICAEDFEDAKEILRAACWAADIVVSVNARYSHIVIIDVIRHRRTE